MPSSGALISGVLGLCLSASIAFAQTADSVLLVVNDVSPDSVKVAEYYAQKRAIAQDHIVHLKAPIAEAIQRADYVSTIESPIAAHLTNRRLQDRVLFIVLTKGVPLRIVGTGGMQGTVASVDSELTLLYRKLLGQLMPTPGRVDNPYFLGARALTSARPFSRVTDDIYLVTRLDGFTVDDVLKVIDRGMAPATTGRVVLDEKATMVDRGGDQWLDQAADRLRTALGPDRVLLETTRAVASTTEPVIGYYSWGSNDPANQLRRFGLTFSPGAIGAMFVSTDGRTFAEPPADWMPSDPNGGRSFGGSFQSLAGDLIRDGITGVAAHVAEPLLDATIRPQVLFPAYVGGFTLAESFYMAMPFLSWQTVVIGDPLCRAFPGKPLPPELTAKGIDPETDLPALFAERGLAALTRTGVVPEAAKVSLRADVEANRGNMAEAERLWVRATEIDPKLLAVQLRLAVLYEERAVYDKAIERYRQVIALNPNHAIALNNLAYALAVHGNAPKDALPFATRAFQLAPSPVVADTVAWIQHLLGDNAQALPLLEKAVAGAKDNAEIVFHLAVVLEALGDKTRARQRLDEAVALDTTLANRADFKALSDRLKPQ